MSVSHSHHNYFRVKFYNFSLMIMISHLSKHFPGRRVFLWTSLIDRILNPSSRDTAEPKQPAPLTGSCAEQPTPAWAGVAYKQTTRHGFMSGVLLSDLLLSWVNATPHTCLSRCLLQSCWNAHSTSPGSPHCASYSDLSFLFQCHFSLLLYPHLQLLVLFSSIESCLSAFAWFQTFWITG